MNLIPKSWYHRVIDELYTQVSHRDDYAIKTIHLEILISDDSDDGVHIRCDAVLTAADARDYVATITVRVK